MRKMRPVWGGARMRMDCGAIHPCTALDGQLAQLISHLPASGFDHYGKLPCLDLVTAAHQRASVVLCCQTHAQLAVTALHSSPTTRPPQPWYPRIILAFFRLGS